MYNKENEEEIKNIKIDNKRIYKSKIKWNNYRNKTKYEINKFMEIDKKDIKKDKKLLEVNYRRKSVYTLHYIQKDN